MRFLPDKAIEALMRTKKPGVVSKITGVRSAEGVLTEGWFIGCPLTPNQMLSLPVEYVYQRIIEAVEVGASEGADICGLGAFTSVVGDGGVSIAQGSPIPVTTGNSYTVATAIEGSIKACELLGMRLGESVLAVVGATGSIGKTCALMLAPKFAKTILVGRDIARTKELSTQIPKSIATSNINEIVEADLVISVTSSEAAVIQPGHLKPGCVICDVARPRDVSKRVAEERHDVLIIEGGVVKVPGNVNFGFDFGFPPRTAYACMSETMILALEGRLDSFTLGKSVSIDQVTEMEVLARRHGFDLAGFRSFERPVSQEAIERARRARQTLVSV